MSEYTPTTYEVMNRYYSDKVNRLLPRGEDFSVYKEFDRWLAQHDLEVAQAERNRTIETLNKHHGMLIDLAELASQDDNDDGWYVERAHTVQKCIELVKKQVN